MQVVFYGTARHIGTSANMEAVAAGLTCYCGCTVSKGTGKRKSSVSEEIILTDCTCSSDADEMIDICDLLVLNLSVPNRELESVYFRHALVRKNVIFLLGKYNQNQSGEIGRLSVEYRIGRSRICTVPYDPGFGYAYETHRVFDYIKNRSFTESCRDMQFKWQIKRTADAVFTYGKRKGELYYG